VGRTGYLLVAGAAVAVIVVSSLLFAPMARPESLGSPANNGLTTTASDQPNLVLVLLKGAEDSSAAVAQHDPNTNKTISLQSNAHIRFESPKVRPPESLKVPAVDLDDGGMTILRKSYDVNNEFFINLGQGEYELRAQASWFDRGTFFYTYKIAVA
jgi:hypothetical protein